MRSVDDSTRSVYEADCRARMRRAGISGELPKLSDGTYKRSDIEADYQTFKLSWESGRK